MRGSRLRKAQLIAEKVFKHYEGFSPRNEKLKGVGGRPTITDDDIRRFVGWYRKTKVPCSCFMCGNPRRHWGVITIAEARQQLEADDQFLDVGVSPRRLRWHKPWRY
jgi:hypothetical protein